MSFDVYVELPIELRSDSHYDERFEANYTSNLGAFFAWALQGVETADPATRCDSRDAIFGKPPADGLIALDGMSAPAAAMKLRKALDRIDTTASSEMEKYNAPNGWGHYDSATDFLRKILRACVDEPRAVVRVSY
jgi:hypothetical protein